MKRKVLKSLIALALTVSMLAGCAQSAVTSGENASGGTSATSQSQNVSSYADIKAESSVTSTASTTAAEHTSKSTESSTDTTKASENKPSQIAGKMRNITSQQLVEDMTFGWNLGNTLDVCQADRDGDGKINEHVEAGEKVDETLWGNPKATKELFTSLKKNGVNAVRIPVTWRDHMDSNGNIDREWMDRVQQVVDYAYSQGMYVIINVHHDGGGDPKFGAWIIEESQNDYNTFMRKYKNVWKQIAERFKNYSDYLIFESMNEVGFDTLYNKNKADAYNLINKINQDFVDIIRATGGNNAKRALIVTSHAQSIVKDAVQAIEIPNNDPNIIVSIHSYAPWDFAGTDSERSTWGTDADKQELDQNFQFLKETFVDKGIPVILDEFGAVNKNNEADRDAYYEYYVKSAKAHGGIKCFVWDNGQQKEFGLLNRSQNSWYFPSIVDAMMRGAA